VKIDWAIPARHLEALADGSFLVLGIGADIVGALEFPTQTIVSLIVSLSCDPTEARAGVDHELAVTIRGVDLEELETLQVALQVGRGDNTPEGWRVRLILPAAMRFEAAQPGTYSIELRTDDDHKSVPILVRDVSAPPDQP
jgi:hypothetical protein